jgi:ribosomal-protein-alanine N-acetyltransferase
MREEAAAMAVLLYSNRGRSAPAANVLAPYAARMALPAQIRFARRNDAPAIARMSRDLIEHGLGWSWTARRVLRSLGDRQTNVVVAPGPAGGVAGFGIMKYHDDEAHLLLLAVDPSWRRRGIGAALVEWLEASALVAGIGQVWLEARITNLSARAFYAHLGYREIRQVAGYYSGVEASVRMARDLWIQRPQRGPVREG